MDNEKIIDAMVAASTKVWDEYPKAIDAQNVHLVKRDAMAAALAVTGHEKALEIAFRYSQIDGSHHKEWAIDQMVRALTGDNYEEFVRNYKDGEDGPDTYEWHEGIAP